MVQRNKRRKAGFWKRSKRFLHEGRDRCIEEMNLNDYDVLNTYIELFVV